MYNGSPETALAISRGTEMLKGTVNTKLEMCTCVAANEMQV